MGRDRKHRPPGLKMSDTFVMLFVQVHYWHLVLPLSRLFELRLSLSPSIILASREFAVRLFAGLEVARVDRDRRCPTRYLAEKKQRPPKTLQ